MGQAPFFYRNEHEEGRLGDEARADWGMRLAPFVPLRSAHYGQSIL